MTLLFDRDFEPRYGERVEIAPGVGRVTAPNEGPFTFRGTNTFLIGRKTLAILDPGPADPKHIDAVMRAVGQANVSHILLSHSHRDHSAGVALLKERTGASVLAALRAAQTSEDGDMRLDARAEIGFAPDRVLGGGEIIELDDHRIEAVSTPGHASDHLAFALTGTDVLFSGDHVMGWSTTVVAPPDGAMGDYMTSLETLLTRAEDTYLPAHGGAIRNGRTYVRALRAHRQMREAAILDALTCGASTVPEIVARVYAGLDPALAPAAALSTLAHIEHLVARGAVAAYGSRSSGSRYRAVPSGSG